MSNSPLGVVVANRSTVIEGRRAKSRFGAVEAQDRSWKPPKTDAPAFEFRNDDLEGCYVLTEQQDAPLQMKPCFLGSSLHGIRRLLRYREREKEMTIVSFRFNAIFPIWSVRHRYA